jgi:5-methylcytosine-specific restriction endonuclease McrA
MPIKDLVKRKEKHREYSKKHYEANRADCIARNAASKKKLAQDFLAFKSRLSCEKCGENHPATLDFHHVISHPSNKKIYQLTRNGAYDAAIKEIMNKCIVLCSNCHRKHHFDERKTPQVALVSDNSSP